MKKLKELAEWVNGTVVGDGEAEIHGVASIEEAKEGEITFVANPKYLSKLGQTQAAAVIVSFEVTSSEKSLLRVKNPYLAFAKILTLFSQKPHQPKGVDAKAWVSPTAHLGKDLTVHPYVYIGDRCRIGDRVTLYPGVYVGDDSSIGEDSTLHPNVSIYPGMVIGKRVILHSGVVVGSDGFGYVKEGRKNLKIPQVGKVEIEDDVEIGSNTTIDRGALGNTIIRRGVKIDNLVQIAHNVVIGEDSIIVAQVGISGSTKIGSNVTLAGQVGLAGHIQIGDNVMVGAQSGVAHDLSSSQAYSGSPAIPHREWLRMVTAMPKVPEMRKRLAELEKRLNRIEEATSLEKKEK
ncbi:MAG: UDP-3-O-(3-hydroxymyristoyl)glucosamine N-acyltransferase [Deltaproteobacteria bacterium RBG_16_48_10]|nr:MAG: UDP-3-O-(3-hydroxymyristoyl)glucosamine N-acyltransferase [Deltaproteobacteria bacterium RBG_16_48_10]